MDPGPVIEMQVCKFIDYIKCIYLTIKVVTGATDGIGKAYAEKVTYNYAINNNKPSYFKICIFHQFVSEGLNVVLVSRNPAKLSAVMDELSKLLYKINQNNN